MKLTKPIQLNRITFFALAFLALVGVAFLTLIVLVFFGVLGNNHTEPHSHPHPHPHDTSRSDTVPKSQPVVEENLPAENTAAKGEPAGQGADPGSKTDPRRITYQAMVDAFEPALALKDTDPVLADAKLHTIARELGDGDPDWTEFFHLEGHLHLNAVPGTDEGYQSVDDAVRYYELKEKLFGLSDFEQEYLQEIRAMVQWNTERHEVLRQTEPIRLLLSWMEENAPAEWDVVNQRYEAALAPVNPPHGSVIENWRTIPQRVEDHYESLFQGLDLLSDDSSTLQEFFGSSRDDAQASLLSEQAAIQVEPPPPVTPSHPPLHTWDSRHDTPVPAETEISLDPESFQPPALEEIGKLSGIELELPTAESLETGLREQLSPERFTRAMSLLNRYGPQEGLQRLKETDPALASQIETRLQSRQTEKK